MGSHEIHHLLQVYGLITVFVVVGLQALCVPLPGSTVLIAASAYAASKHGWPIAAVIVIAAAGATVGGAGGYLLGRWQGERALYRGAKLLRQPPQRVEWLCDRLDRHALVALILSRWFTGARNGAGIAAGAIGMHPVRFLALTALAALLWATVTGLEFYFFGSVLLSAPTWAQVTFVVCGVAVTVFGVRHFTRRGGPDLA